MTSRHAALVREVSDEARAACIVLRDAAVARAARLPVSRGEVDAAIDTLEALGYTRGSTGLEKAWVWLHRTHVLKVAHNVEACDVEARVSYVAWRARLIALTALVDAGIVVQERAVHVVGTLELNDEGTHYVDGSVAVIRRERVVAVQRRAYAMGFRDEHAWNLGVFADGSVKLFDVFRPHGADFLRRFDATGRKLSPQSDAL